MSSQPAPALRTGYRSVAVLLCLGFVGIGFTRLEDRAIIGIPGSPANAMAALAGPAPSSENYDGSPEGFVSIDRASGAPRARIRRLLRDRDVPGVAARQIVSPAPSALAAAGDEVLAGDTPAAIAPALTPISAQAPGFSSLAPSSLGTGTPVFASAGTPVGGGGGTGGAGTGGGGGGTGENPTDPVTPVPEPTTWLMLITGLFGVGAALRRKSVMRRPFPLVAD